ncbi:MAG: SGNH/GDSL hydrolase family protein [Eubacteriales bacterium]
MKRFIILLTALALVTSACAIGASAATTEPKQLLVLGDSISTGYGLLGYDGSTPYACASYANAIANALGLEAGSTYINKAVNGAKSADLLALLPTIEQDVKKSDLIIITIGGNDLLHSMPIVASAIAGRNVSTFNEAVTVLKTATAAQYNALAQNADFQAQIGAVLTGFATNMTDIAATLKAAAPEARIVFLKQYNPMYNVLGFSDFGTFAEPLINTVNTTIEQVCTASGFEVADVTTVINVNAAGLTNILNLDIHPNAAGHLEIAKYLANHLGISLEAADETTEETTAEVTDEETEQTTAEVTEEKTDPIAEETTGEGEKKGCFASVSGAAVLAACIGAFVLIKKKSN